MAKTKTKTKAKAKAKTAEKTKQLNFREMAKRRVGGPVRRLAENDTVEVRFLFEMEDAVHGWKYLINYFDEEQRRSFFFEDADDVPADAKSVRESYFALAYDVNAEDDDPVDVWELRKTMVLGLVEFEEEYGSITDRNFKLKRRGKGMDTKHTATPMDKSPMSKKVVRARDNVGDRFSDALDSLLSFEG